MHLNNLQAARYDPYNAPCFSIASAAYCEHVGSNLQAGGKNGEIATL
ncbi:MAG TPA: hypothetical protein VNK26_07495 [Pyrinomonadaceae bacterium]|nr:hypothetical protein [Pyrinomonadaceae bacterium]